MLHNFHFHDQFIRLIMRCVSSTSISILCNEEVSTPFLPSRGLCQGDPLSPLLFIICLFSLSTLISRYQHHQVWKGIHFGHKSPWLTHMTFTDNIGETSQLNTTNINSMLKFFCQRSGQKINVEKSIVIAPKPLTTLEDEFCYLGFPILKSLRCPSRLMSCVHKVEQKATS